MKIQLAPRFGAQIEVDRNTSHVFGYEAIANHRGLLKNQKDGVKISVPSAVNIDGYGFERIVVTRGAKVEASEKFLPPGNRVKPGFQHYLKDVNWVGDTMVRLVNEVKAEPIP